MRTEEYAGTAKGAALMAIDEWTKATQARAAARSEGERMIYHGRTQAYASVVRLLTGRPPESVKREEVEAWR